MSESSLYHSSLDPTPEHSSDSDSSESIPQCSTIDIEKRMREIVPIVYPDVAELYCNLSFSSGIVKNQRRAINYKEGAVRHCSQDKMNDAFKMIIYSISICPDNEHMDYSLSARSVILFSMNDPISALVDINRVIEKKRVDENSLVDAHIQKIKCTMQAERNKQKMERLKEEKSRMITDPDLFNEIMYYIKLCKRKLKYRPDNTAIDFNRRFRLPTIFSENNLLRSASSKIKIKWNDVNARFLEADKNINIGEVLIVEKPLVSQLYTGNNSTHCSHCFVRSLVLIPCTECLTMFCSEACYNEAKETYHRFECRFFRLIKQENLEFSQEDLVILRLFLKATADGARLRFLMEHNVYRNPFSNKDFNYDIVYDPEDYFNIHNLEDNADKVSAEKLKTHARNVSYILVCLKKMSFFDPFQAERNMDILSELESFAGSLLLKFALCIDSNIHDIYERIDQNDTTSKFNSIGFGIYPTLRLANHSCDENTIRYFCKNHVVLIAVRPIAAGEEIFDNYGVNYKSDTLEQRQMFLWDHYYFRCRCIPCLNEWPLTNQIVSDFSLAIPLIPIEQINMDQVREWSIKAKRLEFGCSEQARYFFYTYLIFLYRTFQKPFSEHVLVEERLRLLFTYRGNYYNYISDIFVNEDV